MKVMDKEDIPENELEIIMGVNHENVVKYFDHFELVICKNKNINEHKFFIITEYCEVDGFFF